MGMGTSITGYRKPDERHKKCVKFIIYVMIIMLKYQMK